MTEGVYISAETGGPATFLPWYPGEPTGDPASEDCVVAGATVIYDSICITDYAAVCECEP